MTTTSPKRALITGITGQDGSYLADLLVAQDYHVYGLVRRTSTTVTTRIDHLLRTGRLMLLEGDLTDSPSIVRALDTAQPDEVYNLAAFTHVGASFTSPLVCADITGLGPLRLFEAVRTVTPHAHVYQASSSEQYGRSTPPQGLDTPFAPCSPYAAAKAFAHHQATIYRDAYGLFICCGVLFNHESERRGEEFVTRKITRAVGRIVAGTQTTLVLGNLAARRDWGYAPDYMEAVWRMLRQAEPTDYVLATGISHSVKDWVDQAFYVAGLSAEQYVVAEPALFRPVEVPNLEGDARKARDMLGWSPSVSFEEMVTRMVRSDIDLAQKELTHAA